MGRTYRGLDRKKKDFLKKNRQNRNKRRIQEEKYNDGQTRKTSNFHDDGMDDFKTINGLTDKARLHYN